MSGAWPGERSLQRNEGYVASDRIWEEVRIKEGRRGGYTL